MSQFNLRTRLIGVDNATKEYARNVFLGGGEIKLDTLYKVDTLVRNLKNSGIWYKIVDMGIFVGDNLNSALTKLKVGPGSVPYITQTNLVAGDYNERGSLGGVQGNGSSKFMDVRIFSSRQINIGDAHFAVYEDYNLSPVYGTHGVLEANNQRFEVGRISSTVSRFNPMTQNAGSTIITPNTPFKLANSFRSNSMGYSNQSLILSYTNNAISMGVISVRLLGTASNVTYNNSLLKFYSVGYGLTATEATSFYQVVQNFQTNLNRDI